MELSSADIIGVLKSASEIARKNHREVMRIDDILQALNTTYKNKDESGKNHLANENNQASFVQAIYESTKDTNATLKVILENAERNRQETNDRFEAQDRKFDMMQEDSNRKFDQIQNFLLASMQRR